MLELLKKHFGYDSFRPLQELIVEHILKRQDALVLMPTGGGKSLCFQLPALMFDGITLVVSPLVSLMKNQVDVLVANGISAEFINSTLTGTALAEIIQKLIAGKVKILYLAPERITLPGFLDFLRELKVAFIAIDEAHCISEWGHDFRPDYRTLKVLREIFPSAPLVAFTATATERVRADIIKQLSLRQPKIFLSSFDRPNLTYRVLPKKHSFEQLVELLNNHKHESAILYCFSRKNTEDLSSALVRRGFLSAPYHAGLEHDVRTRTQADFINDKVNIITATIAFGMGIDKPDVRLVVHCDLPKSIEGYYQETGRAGRDGLPAECVMFFSYADKRKHAYFIENIEDSHDQKRAWEKLGEVLQYGDLTSCRRKYLLAHFDENFSESNCQSCDRCLQPPEEFDATNITQKILSAVIRTGQRFGAGYVAQVLLGENNERMSSLGHDQLSVFGIVNEFRKTELQQLIGFLVARKFLHKTAGEYPILGLTKIGQEFLRERQTITLPKPRARVGLQRTLLSEQKTEYDLEFFDLLRDLRTKIASEKNVPPYVIFGNRTLQEIATYFPQSPKSLAKIFGVGNRKLSEFGGIFLALVHDYAKKHNISEQSFHLPVSKN